MQSPSEFLKNKLENQEVFSIIAIDKNISGEDIEKIAGVIEKAEDMVVYRNVVVLEEDDEQEDAGEVITWGQEGQVQEIMMEGEYGESEIEEISDQEEDGEES